MGFLVFKVVIDTSMLMAMAQKRIDIFGEMEMVLRGRIEFIVPKGVLLELSRIGGQKTKRGRQAHMALRLAEKCKPCEEEPMPGESTDDYLTRLTNQMSGIVATGDVELRKKAKNANIPVVYVRSDLRLAIEGIEPAYG